MKKITLFLTSLFVSITMFAQTQMSGEYTVGTGGSYDYSSMADAGMAIKAAEFTGDVTLLICTDLTETINTGIVNKSEYTLTIRPDKDENRTITYTTATDNTGPTGVFVIGGDMTKTPGNTIGWASIPTKNVVIDGAAEGKTTPRLQITNEVFGTNVLLYGDVQNVVIKNCILTGRSSGTAYALVFRSEKYSKTSKDIAPKNCFVENSILQSSSASSQTVYFQGNEANSVAGWPANITIRNSTFKAHTRGIYVRQVCNLNVEGCTFDMSNSSGGILAHAIMGEGARGTINVKGNKFIKNSTANYHGGSYGLQTITASGGADVWVIENNYFAGYDALKAISNTTNGTEARLVAVRCGDSCVVRHNTFHMPKLTKNQASKLVSASPTTLLWLAGSHKYPVQNNIFVCEETTANVSLIRGGLNENVTGNVFYHKGGNAAIVAAAPSCMIFADLETSYPTQAATSKWVNVEFTDAAAGDLSLAGSSIRNSDLAVNRLAEVLTDITGKERAETTYAGAYESVSFDAVTYTVSAVANEAAMGEVTGAGIFEKGKEVTLTATPKTGHEFVNWSNGSTDNPLVFAATENVELTAYFKALQYTVTVGVNDETKGSVTNAGEQTLDYGTELVLKATPAEGYRFAKWSNEETANPLTITVSGDLEITALFENANITTRAWAYDLSLETADDTYTLSFKATTPADATIIFTNAEGEEVGTHALGTIAAGANKISLTTDQLPEVSELYWAVKMAYDDVIAIREVTDQSRGIYDFYNMMDVLVDNNPESNYFGEIYVQMALAGTTNGKAQTPGLFIFNQELNLLNENPNAGIQPTLPDGYTMGGDRNKFHRLDIDPKTGNLTYCYNISNKPAVFAMDRANLTGEVTNLVAGIDGLLRTSAHCFDADGTLYVYDYDARVSGSEKAIIYKIKDGVKTQLTEATTKFVQNSVTLVSDGKDGLWVGQNRGAMDGYYQLVHVTAAGELDYIVNSSNTHGFTGGSSRGALAYDAERHILAQGRNGAVELFSVTYNAETGVPTLTKFATTPYVGNNIDGLHFDYAGDLYVVNSSNEKFQKFVVPTNNNTCTTPAPKALVITKPSNPTVLDNTVVAPQVEKIVRDGQVLIIRDGKTFNMMGQEVK